MEVSEMFNLLVWIIIGGIAGWLASKVVRGTGFGILGDIIVGIIGGLIGGFIISLLGGAGFTGFNLWSLLVAFLGSVLLLYGIRYFNDHRSPTRSIR
jgi:uncharacterized membrane protein YeaQ/YmgE (transglycosylase-associated protein family)